MSLYDFEILTLLCELENDTHLAEALLFPELQRYAESPKKVTDHLRNSLIDLLDELPTVEFHSRRHPDNVSLKKVELEFKPPKRSLYWNEPVPLVYHALCWSRPGSAHAFIPALTIEVVGDDEESLDELITSNIIAELQRRGHAKTLLGLVWQQRIVDVSLGKSTVGLHVPTPRKRFEALDDTPKNPSILKEVATLLNAVRVPRAHLVEEQVSQLADLLVGQHGRSVLLVGPSGVGKTAIAYELVRQRRHHHLSASKFWETTGARLMVGADSFGDWQERCRQVVAEASQSRAILLLGNLFELAEVARHAKTPQGMAGFFRPYLDRGDLLAVVECTPEQRELMEREHPQLLQTFSELVIAKPSPEKVRAILRSTAAEERLTAGALDTTERLHRRYAAYSACPGRPLRFLSELLTESQDQVTASEVARAFAEESGLPQFMVDDSMSLDLKACQEFFAERLMGQDEAVGLVVDLLASVKAALSPPGRPIASLLFIGPTGVGKTEMARTLAQYLFKNRKRMVRFDMSEFADPYAVERLVGGPNSGQGLLTSKVREQPFGVVLFDELEKADPAFFDLLLQILGEGRLTDGAGRVADFTNSLIVMTSNLGAAAFSKGSLGFRDTGKTPDRAKKQFTSAVKAAFRPELFNRIDRLVPFAPLDRPTATAVAARELEKIQARDGLTKGPVQLELTDEVAKHLAQLGYDKRYGARPLKRAIERELLQKLAVTANENPDKKLKVKVEIKDDSLTWETGPSTEEHTRKLESLAHLANHALESRRRAQKIHQCQSAHDLRNRNCRLERLKQRKAKKSYLAEEQLQRLSRLPAGLKLSKRIEQCLEKSRQLESEAFLAYQGFANQTPELGHKLKEQWEELRSLLLALFASRFEDPNQATLLIFAERGGKIQKLAQAYFQLLKDKDCGMTCYALSAGARETKEQKDDPILRLNYGEELEDRAMWCEPFGFEEALKKQKVGLAIEVEGPLVLPLLLGESGLHIFGASNPSQCEVLVQDAPLKRFSPPLDLHLRKRLKGHKRRFYNHIKGMVDDPHLQRHLPWNGKSLRKHLSALLADEFARRAEELLS